MQLVRGLGAGAGPGSAGDPGAAAQCRAGGPDQHQCHTIRVHATYPGSPGEVQYCEARRVTKKPRNLTKNPGFLLFRFALFLSPLTL